MTRKDIWPVIGGLVLVISATLVGCADAYRKAETEETSSMPSSAPSAADSSTRKTPANGIWQENPASETDWRPSNDDSGRKEAIERVYGKVELGDYSGMTLDWIEANLKPDQVASIVGTPSEDAASEIVASRQGDTGLIWEWNVDGVKGRLRVSIPLREQSESHMMMQAGVTREMTRSGKAELVELGVPGVIAVLRGRDGSELYLFTKDRAVIIDVSLADDEKINNSKSKKSVVTEMAKHLFSTYVSEKNAED